MQEKNFERACQKFAESQKKEPAPGTALNLGDCEEQRGHLIAAAEAFTIAASTYTSSPDKQRYASARAETVEHRTPRLTVRAGNAAAGVVVHVGASVIPVDTEVKMDPGEVVVRAEAPGRRPNTLKATLREGKNVEIDVGVLEPLAGDGASTPGTPGTPNMKGGSDTRDLRPIGIIVAGVGVASLVVGSVTGILALGDASTVKKNCPNDACQKQEDVDTAGSGKTLSTVSTITFIAGGALVVGGAILFFMSPRKAKTTGHVQLVPTASSDSAGFLLHGTF